MLLFKLHEKIDIEVGLLIQSCGHVAALYLAPIYLILLWKPVDLRSLSGAQQVEART